MGGYEGDFLGKRYESGISNEVAGRSNVFLRVIPFEIPAGGIKYLGVEKNMGRGGGKNMWRFVPEKMLSQTPPPHILDLYFHFSFILAPSPSGSQME